VHEYDVKSLTRRDEQEGKMSQKWEKEKVIMEKIVTLRRD
jgi:hypothetical protein